MQYQLKRSAKRRTLSIQIKHNHVIVRAPTQLSNTEIAQFVSSKVSWINRQLAKQSQLISQIQKPLQDHKIKLFGSTYNIHATQAKQSDLKVQGNIIELTYSTRCVKPQVTQQHYLMYWHKKELTQYLERSLAHFQQVMQLQARSYKVRLYKSRWGSCNNKGELSFNTLLAGAPKWVIDYVVVHELAHLRYLHHKNVFWQLVAQYYPDYQKAKDWLRAHGVSLQIQW